MNKIEQENWVFACVERLVDNFPWSEHDIETEKRVIIENIISDAILSDGCANAFIRECLDNGIIEEDYFE
jgi:hypothetical protein